MLIKDYFLLLLLAKSYFWGVFLPIFNKISEKYYLGKSVFNNVNRFNHSLRMDNTVSNKIKDFPRLFALGSQIS